jgi:hypothetical protein
MVTDHEILTGEPYDLADLLKDLDRPLTVDQWNNFDDYYMRMTNDSKSAADVDIGPATERYSKKLRETGSYW